MLPSIYQGTRIDIPLLLTTYYLLLTTAYYCLLLTTNCLLTAYYCLLLPLCNATAAFPSLATQIGIPGVCMKKRECMRHVCAYDLQRSFYVSGEGDVRYDQTNDDTIRAHTHPQQNP